MGRTGKRGGWENMVGGRGGEMGEWEGGERGWGGGSPPPPPPNTTLKSSVLEQRWHCPFTFSIRTSPLSPSTSTLNFRECISNWGLGEHRQKQKGSRSSVKNGTLFPFPHLSTLPITHYWINIQQAKDLQGLVFHTRKIISANFVVPPACLQ